MDVEIQQTFQKLVNVKELYFGFNQNIIRDISSFLSAIQFMESLETLTLQFSHNEIKTFNSFQNKFDTLTKLQDLGLECEQCEIEDIKTLGQSFAPLKYLKIIYLNLSFNYITDISPFIDIYANKAQLNKVEVSLSYNQDKLTQNPLVNLAPYNQAIAPLYKTVRDFYTYFLGNEDRKKKWCMAPSILGFDNLYNLFYFQNQKYIFYDNGECSLVQCKNTQCEDCLEENLQCTKCRFDHMDSQCSKCQEGYSESNLESLITQYDIFSLTCQQCIPPCRTCDRNVNKCTSCVGELRSQPPLCNCMKGYYEEYNDCLKCSSKCLNCYNSQLCIECEEFRSDPPFCECIQGYIENQEGNCIAFNSNGKDNKYIWYILIAILFISILLLGTIISIYIYKKHKNKNKEYLVLKDQYNTLLQNKNNQVEPLTINNNQLDDSYQM